MTSPSDDMRLKQLASAFRMPSVQTMVSRKSSITNAFVNAIIPVVAPSPDEIAEALTILGMEPANVRCAYCGDKASEWDHLRPIVSKQRPTGYISEIANLVPSCGKCNQSKRNANWREWMLGGRGLSPSARNVADISHRVARLEAYEQWRTPTKIDFAAIVGQSDWDAYWRLWTDVNEELRKCQDFAVDLRQRIAAAIRAT